jgi:DNA-binding winged helix-turn-helix (wHTH) protein
MRVRFGPFVLDSETRELLRQDLPVPLSPKAFELLTLLVASRPKAMAKRDLQDRLWPETFVVEKNLPNLIAEIRDAIGDDASNPRFIRTIHRFGYAFREASARAVEGQPANHDKGAFRVRWMSGDVTLHEGEHVLGRDPDAEIFLDHPGISRRHAVIRISGGLASIEDLGSKNGTFVEDRRVNGVRSLRDGEVVRVGSVTLTLRRLTAPRSTETETG